MSRPYLIAIAGGSGSGKTFLARHLAARLPASIIPLDSYYRDLSHFELDARARQNVDVPEALDWDLIRSQLMALTQGRDIERPVYDFAVHVRMTHTERVRAGGYIIVEGLFALYDAATQALCRTKVFLSVDPSLAVARRVERDVRERGRTRESVLHQIRETVAPMYERHVLPTRAHADLELCGDEPAEKLASGVTEHIQRQRAIQA